MQQQTLRPAIEAVRPPGPWPMLQRFVLLWERPAVGGALALVAYCILALEHGPLWRTSVFPYYNYLADAFLHGQLHLRILPPTTHDLSAFEGRYYLYWPPLPAVLLVPFVAAFGVQLSDVAFTIGVAAINVSLVALLLRSAARQQVVTLSPARRGLLVLFFALGTVQTPLAPFGRVWATGQLIGFACVALCYLAAIGLRGRLAFALAGLAIAGALLTRNHLVLAGLWPACYLVVRHWHERWLRLLGHVLAGALPVAGAIALLGLYNWLRFGDALDNGIAYHNMASIFEDAFRQHGAFSLYYLPANLFYQYIAHPFPFHETSFHGGSLFLLSPVFVASLWGVAAGRPRWSAGALLCTILLVSAPILLLMGTGWVQFGPRYTLDFTVPLLLLTALGLRRWPVWLVAQLVALSIATYLLGTHYFGVLFGP